jgi:1,2-diacylglycerol 3-beta-galactosyltransferase
VITVITDLVDVHASWTCPDVDAVVTPSPGGLDHCRRAGIAADRCHDLGLPVGSAFTRPAPDDVERRDLRIRLGLDPHRFTVMLSGGGEGSGGIHRRLRALLRARLDLQVVVICGRNQSLLERLSRVRPEAPSRLRVEGFVSNMAEWMRAADVVISKAGPGTIAEALCSGTPLLLTSYLPGQERSNVAYVVDTGSGRWVPHLAEMVDTVAELAAPGSPALATMRASLGHASRPAAASRIADLVCRLATAGVPR